MQKTLFQHIQDAIWYMQDLVRGKRVQVWVFTVFILNIIGVFYFHSRLAASPLYSDEIDTWATALDITLAHTFVTIPVLVLAYLFLTMSVKIVHQVFKRLVVFFVYSKNRELSTVGTVLIATFYVLLYATAVICFLFAPFWFLIVSPDLQFFLFRQYDPAVGFNYPTTFRLTSLINNFEIFSQTLGNNSTLSKLFGFIGIAATSIVGLVGIMKAFEYLLGRSKE